MGGTNGQAANDNTGGQPGAGTQPAGAGTKTYSQAEVDRMIGERVAQYADYESLKAKAKKYDEAEDGKKTELQRATDLAAQYKAKLDAYEEAERVSAVRNKVAEEKGVPAELLYGATEESCRAQADKLLAYAKPGSYPDIRDGGEGRAPATKKTARDAFSSWFSKM